MGVNARLENIEKAIAKKKSLISPKYKVVDASEESTLTALKQISLADQQHSNKFDPVLKNSLRKYFIRADYNANTRTLQSKEQLGIQPQVVTLARK